MNTEEGREKKKNSGVARGVRVRSRGVLVSAVFVASPGKTAKSEAHIIRHYTVTHKCKLDVNEIKSCHMISV